MDGIEKGRIVDAHSPVKISNSFCVYAENAQHTDSIVADQNDKKNYAL